MSFPLNLYRTIRKYCTKPLPLKKTFFLHIPKCGGTSITQALFSCYARKYYFLPSLQRADNARFLNAQASLKGARLCGVDLGKYREHLLLYFMSMKNVKFITGHYNFSELAYQEFNEEWTFITMLRHPVSRWFSHYFFNRYKEADHFKINDDLASFVESGPGQRMGHFYVYNLTGEGQFGSVSTETVARAIECLEKFSIVGCLEYLDIFLKQIEELYHIKLNIKAKNKNPLDKSKQKEQISEEIMKKVEKICQPDMEIYNFALSRLNAPASKLDRPRSGAKATDLASVL